MTNPYERSPQRDGVNAGTRRAAAVFLLALAIVAAESTALAQDAAPTTEQMIEALKPRTRSLRNLVVGEAASAPVAGPATAAGLPGEPAPTAATAPPEPPSARPSLSMAIRFDFDSARRRPEGAAVLDRLARALQTNDLKDSRFLIEGHTDAKGVADQNLRLSQQRADDKMLVVYDACHSARADPCQLPANQRTRSLGNAVAALGLSGQDVVDVSSSRSDEIGLQAPDSGGSGSVSMQELTDCAQAKMDQALLGNALYSAPNITLSGNRDFVPAWFANAVALPPAAVPPAAVEVAANVPMSRVLAQIHEQRDSKRSVSDALGFSVTSSHAGQVYVAMLGSDGQTLHLLFPNQLDATNSIPAGETLNLPRANWNITAGGPPGTDKLLVIVADSPRDLPALAGAKAGPFVPPLTDAWGRAQLQWLMGTNARSGAACSGGACSDAFGAALVDIEEY